MIDTSAKNAVSPTGQLAADSAGSIPAEVVKNETSFNAQLSALDSDSHTFIAKYPGALGNALQVSLCPFDSGGQAFAGWTFKGEFDAAPGTSTFAEGKSAINDEFSFS